MWIAIWTAALARAFQVWRRYRACVRELVRLDDRLLADVGLTRSDIQAVAWRAAAEPDPGSLGPFARG